MKSHRVGIIMAGNIPLVGFHDFLSVIMAGHEAVVKLSSKDEKLLPFLAQYLVNEVPALDKMIEFPEHLYDFNAVIATGSNNTSRYFDYYFGDYPNIIRTNRGGVGVVTGEESFKQLKKLGRDVFLHFGLGCRNVSKLFVPENYDFDELLEAWEEFTYVMDNSKYKNNYDYNRTLLLMNEISHIPTDFVMLQQKSTIISPLAMVHYETYSELSEVKERVKKQEEDIQCIATPASEVAEVLPDDCQTPSFGKAQYPELWQYADNVDTLKFLLSLRD